MLMSFSNVNAQWNPNGNNATTGFIKANSGIFSANPNNPNATINFSWLNNTPRLRIGGTGEGLNTGFQIQTVGDRNLFTINNSGNIGIGTTSPYEKLHVIGNTRTNNLQLNGGNIQVAIPNTTGGWARGFLYYNPNVYSTNEIGGIGMHGSALTPSRIFIGFGNDPWNTTKGIQVKSNGFVGIGTTNPTSYFDITNGEYKTYSDGNSLNFKNTNKTSYINKVDTGELRIRMGATYNTAMTIKSDLKIGIGTTNPVSKLHITDAGTSGVYSLQLNNRFKFRGDGVMYWGSDANYGLLSWGNSKTYVGALSGKDLALYANGSEKMTITKDGNVGISTLTPKGKLDLGGRVGAKRGLKVGDYIELNEREDINNAGVLSFNSVIDDQDISKFKPIWTGSSTASGMIMSMATGGKSDLTFYGYNWGTDSTPKSLSEFTKVLHLSTKGQIGIGTNAPTDDLHIESSDNTVLKLRTNSPTSSLGFLMQGKRDGSSNYSSHYIGADGNSHYNFKINADEALKFQTNSVDRMFINAIGNVGIGTNNIPSQYKLAVAGSIISQEVTVKLQSAWPDYVFANDYKLPSLKEVEKQIKENGHLANIPSAEEVSENGIELGEMNKKLLEKVEELTLYTIQQEKAIENQNEKIDKQEKELKELKALVQKLLKTKN